MKILKKSLLLIASMMPYLVSSIMLFYTYTANQSNLQKQVETIQQSLSMTETQMHFFTTIVVLLSNILVFIFTFFLIKLLLLIFDRNKESKNEDLFFALVLGYTAANMTALILNDWFHISFSIFKNYIPIIDLITFFTNPAGLDNAWLKQYAPKDFMNAGKPTSSAYDLSILATRLVNDHPEILDITKQRTLNQEGGMQKTTNYSLPGEANGMPGVDGLKTGTSDEAYHFMLTAKQHNLRLQTAVLQVAPYNDNRAKHARHLIANGITQEMFDRYTYKKVLSKGEHRIQDQKYDVKKDLYDVVPKNMNVSDKDFKIDEENGRISLKYNRQFLLGYQVPTVSIEKKGFELFGKEPWPFMIIGSGVFLVILLIIFIMWWRKKMRV
ncbi:MULTISPECIES: DUF1958 domain-containing protein [unclassified Staphylococcus]|uniref:DUF1958 domain-containing protein n=1 Tax=unclassified Staphylococcus TaxID=91994 RepID=UPI0021CFFD5C|nr:MULTISPECIES: DUF1958 domain-containing protein [unclassified Staphylococcus]UXR76574.1 DUF1958 domain-containing protein [Staphylococcus sp. IVB6233]UXR80702.1 DUF1958 domain-containing protein [Staphylococcus sp. IVB6218]